MLWLLVSLCLLQSLAPQAPSRDAPTPRPGTATIRGRVTDKETGQPLARVVVQVSSEALIGNPISTASGEDGRYVLTAVPTGRHAVIAKMPQYRAVYLPQAYGQSIPMDPVRGILSRDAYLTIAEGETRDGIDIRLTRALGISGRVVNKFGEPMSNVDVRVEGVSGFYPGGGLSRQTDDRGAFRLFGLTPGRYRVCADPQRFDLSTHASGEAPQPACAPDGVVLVAADPPDTEIRLQSGRTFTISGVVVDATGAPVDRADVAIVTERFSSGTEVRTGGRFSFRGVRTGEYSIVATTGNIFNPADKRERQVGVVPVRIDGADVEGLIVQLGRGARIVGRLTSEDGPLPAGLRLRVAVISEEPYNHNRLGPDLGATAAENAPFELAELFGPVRFHVSGLPSGWAVKTVRCMDRDVTHNPMEIPPGTTQPLEILITSRAAVVSGRVFDERGEPAPSGTAVYMLSTDLVGDWSPVVPMAMTQDGNFKMPAQRAGEYWIAAVDLGQLMQFPDSRSNSFTARFKKVAERITVAEDERRTIDLRIVKFPEDR